MPNWQADFLLTQLQAVRQRMADQFAYDSSLQHQQQASAAQNQDVANLHDDELFERHQAGRFAEMHLQRMQAEDQQRAAAVNQQQAMGLQAGYDQQRQQGQQAFQGQMAQFEGQQQEARDYRLADIDTASQTQQQDFQASQNTQRFLEQMVHSQVAVQGQAAMEEMRERMRQGTLSQEHEWAVRDYEDQKLIPGIQQQVANGDAKLAPDAAAYVQKGFAEEIDRIANDPYLSQEQKSYAQDQAHEKLRQKWLSAAKVSEPEKAATNDAKLRKQVSMLRPADQSLPWQWDAKNGMLKLPSGYKREPPQQAPMTPQQLQQKAQQSIVDVPGVGKMQWVEGKNGGGKFEPIEKPELQERKQEFAARHEETEQARAETEMQHEQFIQAHIDKRVDDFASTPFTVAIKRYIPGLDWAGANWGDTSKHLPTPDEVKAFRASQEEESGLNDLRKKRAARKAAEQGQPAASGQSGQKPRWDGQRWVTGG